MSALCKFCGQQYANAQAVRAHLKGCAAYQARPGKPQGQTPRLRQDGPGAQSVGDDDDSAVHAERPDQLERPFDPVRQLRQRLEAERLRLQLREWKAPMRSLTGSKRGLPYPPRVQNTTFVS
jgi:hypothetical protein